MRPDATAAEIRDAYRRLARRHHPDRGAADAGAMAAINEAYRVLGDPARRAVYDAARRGPARRRRRRDDHDAEPRQPVRPIVDSTPARIPWKLMLGMAGRRRRRRARRRRAVRAAGPEPPDNLLEPGSCVTIEVNGDAREITCTGDDGELVVEALVAIGDRCPDGTAGHRDRQGRGLACVSVGTLTAPCRRRRHPRRRRRRLRRRRHRIDPAGWPSGVPATPAEQPAWRRRRWCAASSVSSCAACVRPVDRGPRARPRRRVAREADVGIRVLGSGGPGPDGSWAPSASPSSPCSSSATIADGLDDDSVDVVDLDVGDCVDVPEDSGRTEVAELDSLRLRRAPRRRGVRRGRPRRSTATTTRVRSP